MSSIARNPLVNGTRKIVGAMLLALGAAALGLSGAAAPAVARPALAEEASELRQQIARKADSDIRPFYKARDFKPLWLDARGRLSPAADLLVRRIETAELDGIEKKKIRKLKLRSLAKALRRAESGEAEHLARAETKLSETFADYVRAMRAAPHSAMIFESKALSPVVPSATSALTAAAAEPSLENYLTRMGWMHPFYAPLRDALLDRHLPQEQRYRIWQNLERVRALPGTPAERYVLVDAASARLWMYENGKPVDSMRVVVGKPATETPMMAGFLRYAIVNPYWNVPGDLVQNTIARNVLDKGLGYLEAGGYQVLSDWSDAAKPIHPATIDWPAVAAGALQVRVRQLPGRNNFMGKVKFEFPNPQGIYLHDTPDKGLLRQEARQLSAGCVRLEDADRLGRWLLRKPLPRRTRDPEQRIHLPQLVPIYITYLTAMPENGRIAFHVDAYGYDATRRLARKD